MADPLPSYSGRGAKAIAESYGPATDALAARIRQGDERAFAQLFLEHYASLCEFVNSLVRAPDDAEEIVQAVFHRIWEARASWTPKGGVRAYLFAACRNQAVDLLRHEQVVSRATEAIHPSFRMKDDGVDLERLDRFIRREGTPGQLVELEQWVNADPRRRMLAEAMRTIGSGASWSGPAPNAHRALRLVERRRGPTRRANVAAGHGDRIRNVLGGSPHRFGLQRALRAAGVVSVLAGVFALILWDRPAPVTAPPPPRDIVTAPGQRAVLNLGDGTRVVLSAESHLRIPGEFASGVTRAREVWLEGEALFTVSHDSTRPFVVHTPHASAEDLGTEFVVNTYPEIHGMRVAVRKGRVAVRPTAVAARPTGTADTSAGGPTLAVLDAGEVALVRADGRLDVSDARDLPLFFAAAEGSLVLRSLPLRDAIPRLERWFGIRVRVEDPVLLSRRVSGAFRSEAPTEALAVIAIALGSTTRWNRNQVTLMSDHGRGEDQR